MDEEEPDSLLSACFSSDVLPTEENLSNGKLNIKRKKRKRKSSQDDHDAMLVDEDQAVEVGSFEKRLIYFDETTLDVNQSENEASNDLEETQEMSQCFNTSSLSAVKITDKPKELCNELKDVVPTPCNKTVEVIKVINSITSVNETSLGDNTPDTSETSTAGKSEDPQVAQELIKLLPEPGVHKFTYEQNVKLKEFYKDRKVMICPKPGCGKKYNKLPSFKYHVTRCGVEIDTTHTTCKTCGKIFMSDVGFKYHIRNVHPIVDQNKHDGNSKDENSQLTNKEDQSFNETIPDFNQNGNEVNNVIKVPKVKKAKKLTVTSKDPRVAQELLKILPEPGLQKFTNEQNIKLKEIHKTHKVLYCPRPGCNIKYNKIQSFKYHVTRCCVEFDTTHTTCKTCGKIFMSEAGFNYHIKNVHPIMQKDENQDDRGSKDNEVPEEKLTVPRKSYSSRSSAQSKRSYISKKNESGTVHLIHRKKKWMEYIKRVGIGDEETVIIDTSSEDWEKQLQECMAILRNSKDKQRRVPCPKNCGHSLNMLSKLHKHLEVCKGAAREQYWCLLCKKSKLFASLSGIKQHIMARHKKAKDSGSESEYSEGESNVSRAGRQQLRHKRTGADFEIKTETWYKAFHSEMVYPSWRPRTQYWTKLPQSEVDNYLPVRRISPTFQIESSPTQAKDYPEFQLPLFSSTPIDTDEMLTHLTFFVGGSVWAMDWVPVPVDEEICDQYLAIGCHSDHDKHHLVEVCCQEKGVLQIWCTPGLENDIIPETEAKFVFGIAYDYGPLWDIRWCPSGAWDQASTSGHLRRLGLLALACADGKLRILSVPFPESLLEEVSQEDRSNYRNLVFSVTPHVVLTPGSVNRKYQGECGPVWSVAWQPLEDHKKIIGAFGDGTVAIWDLTTQNPLLKLMSDGNLTENLFPISHFQAHTSVIRSVVWCPSDVNSIATTSYDRFTKIWDLRHTSQPTASVKRGLHYFLSWPLHGASLMYSCDIALSRTVSRGTRALDYFQDTRTPNPTIEHSSNCYINHSSTVWCNDYNNWTNILADVDVTGGLIMSVLGKFHTKTHAKPRKTIYRTTFEVVDDSGNTDDSLDTNSDEVGKTNEADGSKTKDYKLIFSDTHPFLSTNAEQKRLNKDMPVSDVEKSTYAALHKVRWNPNITSYNWLASAGRAGIVRICYVGTMD